MKRRLLELIVCPNCQGQLKCMVFSEVDTEIGDGLLVCDCGRWFPIVAGIPRLLPDSLMADFLAKNREMTSLKQGDLIAVMSAGAYGFAMSSTYNSRPRVAEIMVKGDKYYTIRERETYEDLVKGEVVPDFMK